MAGSGPRRGSKVSTDSDTLALLGKKQVLKRRFGFWSLFAFAVCELITWETVLALFAQGITPYYLRPETPNQEVILTWGRVRKWRSCRFGVCPPNHFSYHQFKYTLTWLR
jgi:hypothetical protein